MQNAVTAPGYSAADIDTAAVDQELKNLGEDLGDAKSDDERAAVQRRIVVRQAMRAAAVQAA